MGAIPMIMAKAVINTGRKRMYPAWRAASTALRPSLNCSFAKLTTRMLFAVATPTHMIEPVSAGTLMVVPVINRNQTIPASAAGNAMRMMKGSSHD